MLALGFYGGAFALFFALSKLLPLDSGWRSRTVEIAVPVALALACILLSARFAIHGEATAAVFGFAGAALFAIVRFGSSPLLRTIGLANQEGAFVFLYCLALTFGCAFALASAAGINLFTFI